MTLAPLWAHFSLNFFIDVCSMDFGSDLELLLRAVGIAFGDFSVVVSRCVFGAASEWGFVRCWLHFESLSGSLLAPFGGPG